MKRNIYNIEKLEDMLGVKLHFYQKIILATMTSRTVRSTKRRLVKSLIRAGLPSHVAERYATMFIRLI